MKNYYYIVNDSIELNTQREVNQFIKSLPERPKVTKVEIYAPKGVYKEYKRNIIVKGLKPTHFTIS